MNFLKTKYYPCNIDDKKIINIPFKTDRELSWKYRGTGFFAIKGHRLNFYECYKNYTIIDGE